MQVRTIAIRVPVDSVILDDSLSHDSDGTISNYQWEKISGPTNYQIVNTMVAKATVKQLVLGTYKFELRVTDNKGLIARDT